MHRLFTALIFIFPFTALAQPTSTSTANDFVPTYEGAFGYGTNPGYYPPYYYDKELAALAHGTPNGRVPGVGVTTIRPGLFDHFLDYWGYDIRKDAFQYYQDIGLRNVVAFIGFPADRNREQAYYCPNNRSEMFKNLYEPIWDNGENGTPVNDNNPYALYVWKMATTYRGLINIYEVWNEPDVDTGNGWAPRGTAGNWWENAPAPCETKLKSPPFFYIRTLRISYEVIKSVDPKAFVAVGGLGWASYLDVICRYTDEPFGGAVSGQYPLKGGAYFDCMSFHSYPHLDNSMRDWDNSIFNFSYNRHSDAAVDGIWRLRDKFDEVLKNYGYDNAEYPEKLWICTEFNLPRKAFGEYLGSEEAQVNFLIKALVMAQMKGVAQMHTYALADEKPESEAQNEFSYMGLFKNLNNVLPFAGEPTVEAWALKTTHDQLADKKYNRVQTERMHLPANVRGAAFKDTLGQFTYVLWAVTSQDKSESAQAYYAFPKELHLKYVDLKPWHYSQSKTHRISTPEQVELTGSPVFITSTRITNAYPKQPKLTPNPTSGGYAVYSFWMFAEAPATVEVYDAQGRLVKTVLKNETLVEGPHEQLLDLSGLSNGAYFIRLATPESNTSITVAKY